MYVGTGVNNSTKSHVYKSTDAGAHWQLVSGPGWIWLGALASDPKHPGTLYASASTGIYKTTDGGRTWQALAGGCCRPTAKARAISRSTPTTATSSTRALAAVFTRASTQDTTGKRFCRLRRDDWLALVAATRPTTIYATSFSKWHRIGRREIHWLGLDSSTDGGKTWRATRLHVALKTNAPYEFAADPRLPTTLYAAVQARIFMSTDAGRSWRSIGHGLPQDSDVTSLAADAGTLYAAFGKDGDLPDHRRRSDLDAQLAAIRYRTRPPRQQSRD